MHQRLPRRFFRRDPVAVARALLGQRLVRIIDGQRLSGLIVEVEAYLGHRDQAAHTYNGKRTKRNASMWGDGGHAYVYFTYGMHYCVNIVAGKIDDPVAVLIRALEPAEGQTLMQPRRQGQRKILRETDLCSGPAKLCQALGIDGQLDGVDLVNSQHLFVEKQRTRAYPTTHITVGPRVGVGYAGEWANKSLRFFLKTNPHVSRG